MRRPVSLLLPVLALLLPLLVAAAPADVAGADGRTPTVHAQVTADLAALPATDALEVVVSAWDRAGFEALDRAGVEHLRLRTMPIAIARLTAAQLDTLSTDTRIRSIWPVESYDLLLDEGTAMVGADRVASDLGIEGEGVIVGVIDTGLDTTHPDLDGDKVLGNFQVVGSLGDEDVLVPSPFTDDHGHGTHVASTIAGLDDDGERVMDGVAPGAQLYGYAINAGTSVLSHLALIAFDDLIARKQAGEPIVAASNSWGGSAGTYSPDDPLSISTRTLFENGIVPVFAAGNSGPGLETASNQCSIPWTFCVGAITKGRTLAGFSSRGRTPSDSTEYAPDEDPNDPDAGTAIQGGNHDVALGQQLEIGVYRPNVSAPGVDIEAACSTAAGCPGGYQLMSGTSMATPHVSGVIALVQAASLATTGELLGADAVTSLVENTANRIPGYELWEIGTGEVDALEAVSLVMAAGDDPVAIPSANYGATSADAGAPTSETFTGEVLPNGWETGEGTHVAPFQVSEATGKMTALLTWPNQTDNIYLNLYAPGLTPGEDAPTAQSAGLLDGTGPYLRGYRQLEVHFPQPGEWHLEVLGRANVPTEVTVEITQQPVARPDISIDSLTGDQVAGTTTAGSLAAPGDTGVTRNAVDGTAQPLEVTGEPTDFWLHSNAGNADNVPGAILVNPPTEAWFDTSEPGTPVSRVSEVTQLANDAFAGNFLTAYWRGQVAGAISGDVTFTAWLSSPTFAAFTSGLTAKLFSVPEGFTGVDGDVRQVATAAAEATIDGPPTEVELTFRNVLTDDLTGRDLILQLHSTYIDSGHIQVWHDSTTHPTRLTIPVLEPSQVPLVAPKGLQATDGVGGGAALTWEAVDGASSYVVESSSSPVGPFTQVGTATGTEFTDADAPVRRSTYYRVRSADADGVSAASEIVYATPIDDAPLVEVQFGLGPWEQATLSGSDWVYERIAGTETTEECVDVYPGNSRRNGNGNANGKGKGGPPVTQECETTTTVVRHPLPDGDVLARAGRWFTTSPEASAAR